jgi:hypothetical protein
VEKSGGNLLIPEMTEGMVAVARQIEKWSIRNTSRIRFY